MKKRLLGVLLAIAMVSTLIIGCGSESSESNTEETTEETESEAESEKDVIKIAGTSVSEVFYEAFK